MVDLVDAKVRLKSFTVSDKTIITLGEDDAIIVVGPNNSGKSQMLRDIETLFRRSHDSNYSGRVILDIEIESPLSNELHAALQGYREEETEFYSSHGIKVHGNYIENAFHRPMEPPKFGEAATFFMKRISADDRLSIVAPSAALEAIGPETPGQVLYDNESLLEHVSHIFHRAFNQSLFLNYRSGGQIPIYVGTKPPIPDGCDRVSDEYVALVRSCDKLHEQGDGMKSFGGILLSTLVVNYNLTMIDEPEAFLHPPQERIIGKILSEETSGQVICATHSTSVLQGFLESDREGVRVVRIVREQDVNHVSEISPEEIRDLWRDPVFRYSTAFDALFHDQAILCEADADCRFYEAIADEITGSSGADSHYIPCGGKAAFPKFIKALKKVSIPTRAILDLDVLNNEELIKNIYEAQGGDWTELADNWQRLNLAIRNGIQVDSVEDIKANVAAILEDWTEGNPPLSDVQDCIKQSKPWGKVKAQGLDGVPNGDARQLAEQLIASLAAKQIYPVPVGTLENFVPTIGNRGTKWLNEVLGTHSLGSAELVEARDYMARVLQ